METFSRNGNNYWFVHNQKDLDCFRKRDQEALKAEKCPRCNKTTPPVELLPLGPHIAVCKPCADEWWEMYNTATAEALKEDDDSW